MLSDSMKTEDFPVNNILHPITRHSPHHSLQKRLQNSYFEGRDDACGRLVVVSTTPDAARCRAHGPPPCPKPFQPKSCPAPASPAPFTPAVMAVAEGRERGAHRHINRPPQAAWHVKQPAHETEKMRSLRPRLKRQRQSPVDGKLFHRTHSTYVARS
jgi:hypothetical protein